MWSSVYMYLHVCACLLIIWYLNDLWLFTPFVHVCMSPHVHVCIYVCLYCV